MKNFIILLLGVMLGIILTLSIKAGLEENGLCGQYSIKTKTLFLNNGWKEYQHSYFVADSIESATNTHVVMWSKGKQLTVEATTISVKYHNCLNK